MRKFLYLPFVFLFGLILFSCASGSALVTGPVRSAIKSDKVVVYSEPPANYEVIGIVSATSDGGLSQQSSLNHALDELKKQAAKIGANGIIIENINTSSNGGVIVGNIWVNVTSQNITGKAIYVYPDDDLFAY